MIDFSKCYQLKKGYTGANGSKICVLYNNEIWMLKFSPQPKFNEDMSYTNSCFSEYIGSHIFESIGIKTQETLLGIYTKNEKTKIVVACKDFTSDNKQLMDFASLKNQIVDSTQNGYGTELSHILECIDNQNSFDPLTLKKHFWNMFVVDAFIGNWDRHNGNWGFLYKIEDNSLEIAPIFDCGSSLYPQADKKIMNAILTNQNELKLRIFEKPHSAIKLNNKNIQYFSFMSTYKNEEFHEAIKEVFPKINMFKIQCIVNDTPYINNFQKKFYLYMLEQRYTQILKPVYENIMRQGERQEIKKNQRSTLSDTFYER